MIALLLGGGWRDIRDVVSRMSEKLHRQVQRS
jgi:hypothetical protein